jgi:hypothetical protein
MRYIIIFIFMDDFFSRNNKKEKPISYVIGDYIKV